jgi:hypothetical protein
MKDVYTSRRQPGVRRTSQDANKSLRELHGQLGVGKAMKVPRKATKANVPGKVKGLLG